MSDPTQENPQENPPEVPPAGSPEGEGMVTVDKDSRMWAMLVHLTGASILVGVPGFIGPLVIWLIKREDMPFVDREGKESLNFQITLAIVYLISTPLAFFCIGFITAGVAWIMNIVFCIIAAVKANNGEAYRYPLTLRLIK